MSSTPPLEVVRHFCSLAGSSLGLVLQFVDVSRALPYVKVLRGNSYTEPPAELGLPSDMCVLLHRYWHGTRDAGQGFEVAVRNHYDANDCNQGIFTPCIYKHWNEKLMYFAHGDDDVGLDVEHDLEWYRKRSEQALH